MTTASAPLFRRVAAEFGGSASLTAMVVGSGIAATNLTDDVGIQLLINAIATAFGLFVLITVLGPLSGAHVNPVVSLADYASGGAPFRDMVPYITAQILGCIAGSILANIMFDLPPAAMSSTDRISSGHLVAEVVATAGLVFAIFALARSGNGSWTAGVVATYVGSAYFFTSSTSFANPAITIGRMFTDTFAGISPASALPFIGAQLLGAALGWIALQALIPAEPTERRQASAARTVPTVSS